MALKRVGFVATVETGRGDGVLVGGGFLDKFATLRIAVEGLALAVHGAEVHAHPYLRSPGESPQSRCLRGPWAMEWRAGGRACEEARSGRLAGSDGGCRMEGQRVPVDAAGLCVFRICTSPSATNGTIREPAQERQEEAALVNSSSEP